MNANQNSTQTVGTFEDLQQHMDSFDLDSFDRQRTLRLPNLGEYIDQLASVYEMVEPVLVVVGTLPLFPATWRRALTLLMDAVETVIALAGDPPFEEDGDLDGDDEVEDEIEDFKAGRDLEEFKAGRDLEE